MTLQEAASHIGSGVVYRGTEDGTIMAVNGQWVFVRYGADRHSKATDPADLTLSAEVRDQR